MVGIVLASHGALAEGMKDAAVMLFGSAEQVTCVSLLPGEDSAEFLERLRGAIDAVDTGEGTIVLCDILGGTPSNRSAMLLDRAQVIAGMNLPLLLELLGQRLDGTLDLEHLLSVGRNGVVHMNPMFHM